MKRASKAKGQESVGSSLLSPQENERLEDLLGRRCVVSKSRGLQCRPEGNLHSRRKMGKSTSVILCKPWDNFDGVI